MRSTTLMTFAVAAVLTTGCSGSSDDAVAGDAAATSSSAAASEPTAGNSSTGEAVGAETILLALQDSGLPITDSATVTEANDANNLIGRPGQYVSKVAFADSRIGSPIDHARPVNDAGGSIEVFASAADAQTRSDYIQQTLQDLGPVAGTEYHYLSGTALVRVTGELPPSAAEEYESAVAGLS